MTSQGVDGTVDKAGHILPNSNQRVKALKGETTMTIDLPSDVTFKLVLS